MSNERLKVLEMIENGKISAQEGLELLKHMPDEEQRQMPPWNGTDFSWLKQLQDSVSYWQRRTEMIYEATSSSVLNGIREIKLKGKNNQIEIVGSQGDCIQITVRYVPHNNENPDIRWVEQDGCHTLEYEERSVHSLGIFLKVPAVALQYLYAETTNGAIKLSRLNVAKIEFYTINAAIHIDDVSSSDNIFAETRNGAIALENIKTNEIELKSSNAKISISDAAATKARIQTSNGKIQVENVVIPELTAKTSNGAVDMEFDNGLWQSQDQEYKFKLRTSNGVIKIRVPEHQELAYHLEAATSHGKVINEFSGLRYKSEKSNYVEAQSEHYDIAQKKINLDLKTSNGNIHIYKK